MIGCVIAMDSEAEILRSQMEESCSSFVLGKKVTRGRAFGKDVFLIVTGEGKVNAAAGAVAAIGAGADVLLNFGAAGGLSPACTKVGGIYLVDRSVQYDFDLTQLSGGKIGTLPGRTDNFLPLCCPQALSFPRRALGTGDRFNDSKEDHSLLLSLGCDVRDMEGGAIAQIAEDAQIPLISVKTVSDVYGTGSTTEQFQKNLQRALAGLRARLCEIFAALE